VTKRTLKNPYRGINAHLHSMAQNPERSPTIWTSIHASHIGDITRVLNTLLPANYIARAEQSLQIWTEEIDSGDERKRQPRPDVGVFRSGTSEIPVASTAREASAGAIHLIPIRALLMEDEITISSVVIYKPEDIQYTGEPITRIELLSESNKIGGTGYKAYLHNRAVALASGTSLIELDYLHQTASSLPGVPAYPDEPDSHAYTLTLIDRREDENPEQIARVHGIDVDMTLPTIPIPLAGSDNLLFDFEAVYQRTFEGDRWGTSIDYDLPPIKIESYSAGDRARIRDVMERIAAEQTA
jgi:Protein of unknown function (DUF4058)